MFPLLLLICTVSILTPLVQSNDENGKSYSITEFKKGSGIYYEYVGNLKLSSANWRVAVFVDVQKQNKDLDELLIKKNNLTESCINHRKQCELYMEGYDWNGQWELAMELKTELENALTDLSKVNKDLPTRHPKGIRVRRRTALLGFLGKIVGPVAGVLNYDDEDRINEAIQELNVQQANISHLIGKQTHVVRAQLDLLHKQAEIHDTELQQLKAALKDITERSEMGDFSLVLQRISYTIEKRLQHYLKTGKKMLEVIYAARKGNLHPTIVTFNQLLPIMRDIQDNKDGLKLPIRGSNFSIDELIQISHTFVRLEDDHLKILVDIPLILEPFYSIYKLHPLPTFQSILGNKTGKAYIDYKNSYLAIDDIQVTYMTMDKEDLNSCKKTAEYYMCQNGPAIYKISKYPSCEIQMLLQPSVEALKTCTIRLQYDDEPFWQRLQTIGGWLYSLKDETNLNIKCLSNYNSKVTVSGAGLLQLAPGCTARALTINLPALQAEKGISETIYESNVELNLKKLAPILEFWNKATLETSKTSKLKDDITAKSEYYQNADTLDQLEQQLYDLSLQSQQRNRIWWAPDTYVNYLLIAAVTVTVIYFGSKLYFTFFKSKKNNENVDVSTINHKTSERVKSSEFDERRYGCHCSSMFDHSK